MCSHRRGRFYIYPWIITCGRGIIHRDRRLGRKKGGKAVTTIGENLRRIRKGQRIGQIELARLSGTSQTGISEIELGKREAYPSTLEKLAAALAVPVTAFFEGTSPPRVPPPPPPTPLTDEPEDGFDRRFSETDAESAEKLQDRIGAEFDALRQYVKDLKAAGVGDDDFKVRQARRSLAAAKRRTLAATSRATDLAINREFGGDREIHDSVEAYVGAALEVDAYHGEEAQQGQAHPEAG